MGRGRLNGKGNSGPAKMLCGSAKRLNALTALSERHTHNSPGKPRPLNVGDVVIICSEKTKIVGIGPLVLCKSCLKAQIENCER